MLETEAFIAWRVGGSPVSFDLDLGSQLLRPIETADPDGAFVTGWRLLMSSFLQGQQDLREALDYARASWRGKTAVNHPELLHAMATVHEMAWVQKNEMGWSQLDGDLQAAVRDLRRSLDVLPDPEAAVRLGRILTLEGHYQDAARVLAGVGEGTEPAFLYLARLFEGDLAERGGDVARAEQCYEAAIDTVPAAQSARIALAHLRHASGRRADAAREVEHAVASNDAAPHSADPWAWYARGFGWRTEAYRARLREMVRSGSTP